MIKYPKGEYLESVLDIIDEKGYCTRKEIAERNGICATYTGLTVGFLIRHRLVEQRKEMSSGAPGPKNRRIYIKYNRCVLIVDLSGNRWRCIAMALCKKVLSLYEYEYSFDMDFFDNINRFLSDVEYVFRRRHLPHIVYVTAIMPSRRLDDDLKLDFGQSSYPIPYPTARSIVDSLKSFAGKHSVIPLYFDTLARYCAPNRGIYISVKDSRINCFSGPETDIARAADMLERFSYEWSLSRSSQSRVSAVSNLFESVLRDPMLSGAVIDFDSVNCGLESKLRKEIDRISLKLQAKSSVKINSGGYQMIYNGALRLSLRIYIQAILQRAKETSEKQQIYRVSREMKKADK